MLRLFCALSLLWLPALSSSAQAARPAQRPKLVVVLMIDQFRYDYLTRFQEQYTGGFRRLLDRGAVFTNAYLQHFPTVTAVGHATVTTGALPSLSGIVNNVWFDRAAGRNVTSVGDPNVKVLGAESGAGASPHRLLVSTVGDELKMSGREPSRVIGISVKDRAAILPAGRLADGAYWFQELSGNFVSSTWYFPDLPAWVKEFNAGGVSRRFLGAEWKPVEADGPAGGTLFANLPAQASLAYYRAMLASPYGNELVEQFAERAVEAEKLGARGATDVLTVSFSSNDHVGHATGPDSPEVRDICLRTDKTLERFFRFLDERLGLEHVLVVFSADHGVAPVPEVQQSRRMPGGRMAEQTLEDAARAAVIEKYGSGEWIAASDYGTFYLNERQIREKNLTPGDVQRTVADALAKVPHVARVYTREQLVSGRFHVDEIGRRVANGFHPHRSGDVIALLEPYWLFEGHGTTHGSAYSYDSHVPVVFLGAGIWPGRYDAPIAVNDIAPTLATMLDVETPSGSSGRVLSEILVR